MSDQPAAQEHGRVDLSAAYPPEFYEAISAGAAQSARLIVPTLAEIIRPSSVIDVGCGTGTWLQQFRELGTDPAQGLDGPWVPLDQLVVPDTCFTAVDLGDLGEPDDRVDLALCLEVGEHLSPNHSMGLVAFLTAAAPTVVFSSAVPGQGGVGHVNEQWLDYWADIFAGHGYGLFDVVRRRFWDDERIEPWYTQNIVVFADLAGDPDLLARLRGAHSPLPLRIIHPRVFRNSLDAWAPGSRTEQ